MADITNEWNRKMPSGSSDPSDGDDLLRQHWTSIESTWDEEHFFSGSSTSAGIHKEGSARIYRGPASEVSSGGRDDRGRLMFAEDEGTLHYLRDSSTSTIARELSSQTAWATRVWTTNDAGPASGNTVTINWNNLSFEEGSFWTNGGSGAESILTVPSGADGRYEVSVQLPYFATGGEFRAALFHNASIVARASSKSAPNSANENYFHISDLVDGVSSGDTFEVRVHNVSASGLTFLGTDSANQFLWLQKTD